MKRTFQYEEYAYEYYVEYAERKTLALEVMPDLRIITKVPFDTTLEEIESFLTRKWRWLEKQLGELRKLRKNYTGKQYVSGESFYYLGRQYMLLVESATEDAVKLERGKLRIYTSKSTRNTAYNKKLLDGWYERRQDKVFKHEYIKALSLFDFRAPPQLGKRHMIRRWGSYTSYNKVLLNPRLIEAPREAIYYVCIHELCHKITRKHDEVFYRELEKRLLGWKRIKESLEIRHG